MKSVPSHTHGAPRPPRPAAPTVEIGLLQQLHAKGFGFAQPLTGDPRTTVFLNESRIAALRAQQPQPEGALVRMRVVDKADGKRAATEVRLLELNDSLAAQRLWERAGQDRASPELHRLQALLPERPALLPLLLVLVADQLGNLALLQSLAAQWPAHAWQEPALHPLLHLAPAAARRGIMQQQLLQAPEAALALLRGTPGQPALEPEAAWLEELWSKLPPQRPAILDQARRLRRYGSATEKLTWARRRIEQHSDPDDSAWDTLAQAISSDPASWPADWDHWPALANAPAALIHALAPHRHPVFAAATQALQTLADWTARHAQFDANELLLALDEQDKALASQWIGTPAQNPDAQRAVLAQMQTARAAEKGALRYFRSLGLHVRDISIGQLSGEDNGWPQMDLQINGAHGVDVKNCRRTVNGGMRSGRWKVKAFKADAAGRAVTLCGVSSPHTRFEDGILTAQPRRKGPVFLASETPDTVPMFVLGVVRAVELHNLNRRFHEISEIRLHTPQALTEMPVWAWDYPDAHYRPRNQALDALRQALATADPSWLELRLRRDLPPVLWSLLDQAPPEGARPLDEQQQEFLQELRRQWRHTRASETSPAPVPRLPWLYLFILHSWLRRRLAGKASDAQSLETLFHPAAPPRPAVRSDRVGTRPERHQALASLAHGAGIADPAQVIAPLLKTLAALDQHLPPGTFVGIRQFTLLGNGIFSGIFPDGQRRTLLAHCGGKLQDLLVDCGKWPLVYGREESCACGRLICGECHCCSDPLAREPCPHQQQRQAQAAQAREARDPRQQPGAPARSIPHRPFFQSGRGDAGNSTDAD
ncbi:hypothetical protein [Solimonas sp. SE-A11]|uniref:hypothetical protein n=1 Tax=Solimonas sp. SE-A11 TaxID=3054954 RepID=UPI00259CB148|nr:hypothetical protein [Solimonas sp. SE-A11]MDM4769080.1 hypothetical protein [Solimonas sp. SE-A11]